MNLIEDRSTESPQTETQTEKSVKTNPEQKVQGLWDVPNSLTYLQLESQRRRKNGAIIVKNLTKITKAIQPQVKDCLKKRKQDK